MKNVFVKRKFKSPEFNPITGELYGQLDKVCLQHMSGCTDQCPVRQFMEKYSIPANIREVVKDSIDNDMYKDVTEINNDF